MIEAKSILALSSTVAVGHVGLSAIVPTFNLIGQHCAALPTTILANHPGFAHTAGTRVAVDTLTAMVDSIEHNQWLGQFGTILTGYLPSRAHVDFAVTTIARLRRHDPDLRVVCDPVLGDDPKGLYIDADAAAAIRDRLVPLADTLLPNRFELGYLGNCPITSPQDAVAAARGLAPGQVIAKSIPRPDDRLCNIDVRPTTAATVSFARQAGVPNGTGDMFSALIAAGWPLARATGALNAAITESLGRDHLAIVPASHRWATAPALPLQELP